MSYFLVDFFVLSFNVKYSRWHVYLLLFFLFKKAPDCNSLNIVGKNMDFIYFFAIIFIFWSTVSALNYQCNEVDASTLQCNYIPKDIPNGFTRVRIIDFLKENKTFEFNSSYFMSKNWEDVTELQLQDHGHIAEIIFMEKCFIGLKSLRELHMNLPTQIQLDSDVFVGLDNLKFLDLSECVYLNLTELVKSFTGSNKLPSLETLKASNLNIYNRGISFDTQFAEALGDKQITSLDFSYTKITEINITAVLQYIQTLKNVNISHSTASNFIYGNKNELQKLKNINMFDMCHVPVSWLIPFTRYVNMAWNYSDFPKPWNYFFYPKIVNMTSRITGTGSIHTVNCTYIINVPFQWKSEELIIKKNNIKHLDLKMECSRHKIVTIKHINAAGNQMEFLHPSILGCTPNLEKLDLSNNKLHKMAKENHLLFQQLFQSLSRLISINLSFNRLQVIPENLFTENRDLELIDFSHNELEQVTFTLKHLYKLKVLNLQYNRIKILSSLSINNLNSIFNTLGNTTWTLDLGDNPISCSNCEAKQFIYWLTHTNSVSISTANLACTTLKNTRRKIDTRTLDDVNNICKRTIMIISTTVSVGFTFIIVLIVIMVIYKRRKRANKRIKRGELVNRLQEGQGQNEFVAFLSYSSEDKDFVDNFLIDDFNETLQHMTGIDRNLICTGDLYLRPGFRILDEISLCIERASAFIVVVSDSYNSSPYCHNELDIAYRLQKPIVLFIKGTVDESLMTPVMKSLFNSNVRVLWTFKNQDYTMMTSWQNVCSSLLDLIIQNENI
ncbi:toll-like receptor 4 [Ruditapes philippinarum]|uniref:toll-like receptor 4 n=1 Tax=Ruditapes philippinarum TaxID=129788 RepID=UPI00295ABE2C|nr:toll-like receptor 4 [Ruditapes philippinarum]